MSECYDVAVLGLGGFGSACLHHLARRGARVIGFEQYHRAHSRGSSHGQSRIIRQAYFEHPDYVPLLKTAYTLWSQLERDSGVTLSNWCGLLLAGPPQGNTIAGARLAAERHDVTIETVDRAEFRTRFPGFEIPESFDVVLEPAAGMLFPEKCISVHLEQAELDGATVREGSRVVSWRERNGQIELQTETAKIVARELVITSGAWGASLLRQPTMRIVRKPVFWFPVEPHQYRPEDGCPGYFFEMPGGEYYGFPSLDGRTVKIAEHSGGEQVEHPDQLLREVRARDLARIQDFIKRCMPRVSDQYVDASVCMYTLTPDHHFIVDRHPDYERVTLGLGFSGHGFKFTSVLGLGLADLAVEGATDLPIEFLQLGRFSH